MPTFAIAHRAVAALIAVGVGVGVEFFFAGAGAFGATSYDLHMTRPMISTPQRSLFRALQT